MKKSIIHSAIASLTLIGAGSVFGETASQTENDAHDYSALHGKFMQSFVKNVTAFAQARPVTGQGVIEGQDAFWVAIGVSAATDVYKVDGKTGEMSPLLETQALQAALLEAGVDKGAAAGVSAGTFQLVANGAKAVFAVQDKKYAFDLETRKAVAYTEADFFESFPNEARTMDDLFPALLSPFVERHDKAKEHFVTVKDHNLYLRTAGNEKLRQLTKDGVQWYSWGGPRLWQDFHAHLSPDGKYVFAQKIDVRDVNKVPLTYWLEENERADEHVYPLTGEAMQRFEPHIINTKTKRVTPLKSVFEDNHFIYPIGWRDDSSEAWFAKLDRLNKEVELLAVDPATRKVRSILTETSETYIDTPITAGPTIVHMLSAGNGFLLLSERTGWRHIYHYNDNGELVSQLTDGEFPVLEIAAIDENSGYVYYYTPVDKARPYDRILHRVALSGGDKERLVDTEGYHQAVFAEDYSTFLVTHSSIANPPVTDVRQADGTLIKTLARFDTEKMPDWWKQSEEFVVKARDGKTDIHGVIMFPADFDPKRSYPVIELIYGGMQANFVPHAFLDAEVTSKVGGGVLGRNLTYSDHIVVHLNTPGTRGRGKAFQDATYGSWPQGIVEEHAHAIRELAATRSYIDVDRVGVAGASWGGYMTLRALIYEPDLYKVGISLVPVASFDQTLYYSEIFMGGDHKTNPEAYAEGSLLDKMDRLQGELMLVPGPLDVNANFAQTMKAVDKLIDANKDHSLVIVPDMNHSLGCCGAAPIFYVQTKMAEFFKNKL